LANGHRIACHIPAAELLGQQGTASAAPPRVAGSGTAEAAAPA